MSMHSDRNFERALFVVLLLMCVALPLHPYTVVRLLELLPNVESAMKMKKKLFIHLNLFKNTPNLSNEIKKKSKTT